MRDDGRADHASNGPREREVDQPAGRMHHDNLGSCTSRSPAASDAAARTSAEPGCHRSTKITRRRFLGQAAAGMAGLAIGPNILVPRASPAGTRGTTIVRAFHPDATTGWSVNQEPVGMMVHAAIRGLTGIGHTAMAWKSLFPGIDATKKIGIKINLSCGDVPTHPEVVNAIIDGLLLMDLDGQQLPENHVVVWDLDTAFFCAQTGYAINYGGEGVQYYGTDHPLCGHDLSLPFSIEHAPGHFSEHHPSKIISQRIDYMINAAVIKDHNDAGVTFCLKNNYGSFDNIPIWEMHISGTWGDGHTRGEPELNRVLRDELGDKTKLFLIDGTLGLYDGGPGYIPPYHTPPNWAYNSVIVGTDPVAVDRIGTIVINEERRNHGIMTPLDPSHVYTAAQPPYNLGTDDPEQIDLVEIDASLAAEVHGDSGVLRGTVLLAPYPNPVQGSCMLRLQCARESEAEIIIADVSGAVVRRVASGRHGPGTHSFRWDGCDEGGRRLSSGTYFCRLKTPDGIRRQRVVIVR